MLLKIKVNESSTLQPETNCLYKINEQDESNAIDFDLDESLFNFQTQLQVKNIIESNFFLFFKDQDSKKKCIEVIFIFLARFRLGSRI